MKKISIFILISMIFNVNADDKLKYGLEDGFENIDVDSILTSTKLKTSKHNAPASITKITAEQIAINKYRNVPEALRSVPGMIVVETHTSSLIYSVGYHGGNAYVPRRMNVLIDGVSFYQPGLSRVHWEILPVDMDNIYSIEVIRGPAASLYGSNSFTSVVNITTKRPQQLVGKKGEYGFRAKTFTGDSGVLDYSLKWGGMLGDTGISLNYFHREDDGFDLTSDMTARHDSKSMDSFGIRVLHEVNTKSNIDISAGITKEKAQEQWVAPPQTSFPDYTMGAKYFSLKYSVDTSKNNNFLITLYSKSHEHKQSWNANLPAILLSPELSKLFDMNPNYATALVAGQTPTGGSPEDDIQAYVVLKQLAQLGSSAFENISSTVLQNYTEKQKNFEIQNIHRYNKDLRFVTGGSINKAETINDDWVFNKPQSIITYRLFSNMEYSLSESSFFESSFFENTFFQNTFIDNMHLKKIVLNLGAMYEHDKNSGSSISPRFAIKYQSNPNLSFRYIISTAERTPDQFEQFANWRYIGTALSSNPFNNEDKLTYYAKAVAKGELLPEKIVSNEIGVMFLSDNKNIEFDLRIFNEKQSQLISEKLALTDFNPTNNGNATIIGAELQFSYKFSPFTLLNASYSYTDSKATTNEKSMSVNNVLYVSINHQLNEKTRANFYYYGLSHFKEQITHNFSESFTGKSLDHFDANISYTDDIDNIDNIGEFEISLHLKHRNSHSEFDVDNFYKKSNAFYLNTSISF